MAESIAADLSPGQAERRHGKAEWVE